MNEQQGVRLAYVELGNARIELMEPSRPDSPVAKFLERNPEGGIHHFCLGVDERRRDRGRRSAARARACWATASRRLNVHGERIAFVHPKDFLGALVELEEEHKA